MTGTDLFCRDAAVRGQEKTAENSLGLPDPDHATDIAGSFKGQLSGLYGILRPLVGFSKS